MSEDDLCQLLGLSPAEVRQLVKWTNRKQHGFFSSFLSPHAALPMEAPVEEIRRLRDAGELRDAYPALPDIPRNVLLRWRQLQELLKSEAEFETRYPVAHDLLRSRLGRLTGKKGLPLPSFGIRVMRHDPQPTFDLASLLPEGDACSANEKNAGQFGDSGPLSIDWKFSSPDTGYLRALLLAVLGRDEYEERIAGAALRNTQILEGLDTGVSPVRITDLRLATSLNPDTLNSSLLPLLSVLERPLSADRVVEWKQQLLEENVELLAGQFKDPTVGKLAVSFAASSLWLFLDFNVPTIESATSYRLAEKITDLARLVKDLSDRLYGSADRLEKLLANRPVSRPPQPRSEYYQALRDYRMGREFEEIAERLSLTPWDSQKVKGTKDWKKKIKQKIARGKEVENEHYPIAATIFGHEDHPAVLKKADTAYYAYQAYLEEIEQDGGAYDHGLALWAVGIKIDVNARNQSGQEKADAFVQLGHRRKHGRPPLP